jgi:hypothetical protein
MSGRARKTTQGTIEPAKDEAAGRGSVADAGCRVELPSAPPSVGTTPSGAASTPPNEMGVRASRHTLNGASRGRASFAGAALAAGCRRRRGRPSLLAAKCRKRQREKLTQKEKTRNKTGITAATGKFFLRIVGPRNPRENRRAIDRIERRDRLHKIKGPTALAGITTDAGRTCREVLLTSIW